MKVYIYGGKLKPSYRETNDIGNVDISNTIQWSYRKAYASSAALSSSTPPKTISITFMESSNEARTIEN